MADVTIKRFDDLESYNGEGRFRYAGRSLGVSAWGMNILMLPAQWSDYPDHDHTKDGQEEVYLVLRPRGGHADYHTFWHEHGHAHHFASMDPELSFEARWLGDNSVTEGFAMLFDHMTLDPRWLMRYPGLESGEARDLVFELGVNELFMLRRYAAKLAYEIRLHRGDLDRMGPEYAERLTEATLFRYPEGEYLLDVDPGFYSARYLRAWQLQALLASQLTERFDEDWFRNPRAGGYIQHLMSRGQADNGDQLAKRVGGGPLSFEPLRRSLEQMVS